MFLNSAVKQEKMVKLFVNCLWVVHSLCIRTINGISHGSFQEIGNAHFKNQDFKSAIESYSQGIAEKPNDSTLYSNRSATYMEIHDAANALADAEHCLRLDPKWTEGYLRKGAALHSQRKYYDAIMAYAEGSLIDRSDKCISDGMRDVYQEFDKNLRDMNEQDFTARYTPFANAVGVSDNFLDAVISPRILAQYKALQSHGPGRNVPGEKRASLINGLGFFAGRDFAKGEVIPMTWGDSEAMNVINDGAQFPGPRPEITSLEGMGEFYKEQVPQYKLKSAISSNVDIVRVEAKPGDELNNLRILKDIKKGEEMTRSYGVPGWMAQNPADFGNNRYFESWAVLSFAELMAEATPGEREEALVIFAIHLMHQRAHGNLMRSVGPR